MMGESNMLDAFSGEFNAVKEMRQGEGAILD